MSGEGRLYIVNERILPEAVKKTIRAKEIIAEGQFKTINEAVAAADLSRSAYYKYKDYIFPFFNACQDKVILLSMVLKSETAALVEVLRLITEAEGKIVMVNQGVPLSGVVQVTLAADTKRLLAPLDGLLEKIRNVDGVATLVVNGQA